MRSAVDALLSSVVAPSIQAERRVSVRQLVEREALSRPLELADGICWGAVVKDLSAEGLGLIICYPFKLGTHLAVDVRGADKTHPLLVRVVHVTDQSDGTWFMGCELVMPLHPEQMKSLV